MKQAALEAASDERPTTLADAERIVSRIFRDCKVTPFPPPKVVAFYAGELLALASDERRRADA